MSKTYKETQQARPENQHWYYKEWMMKEKYLKDRLDESMRMISALEHQNKDLKDMEQFLLPKGRQNERLFFTCLL